MSAETFTGPDGREYFRHVPGDEMPCDGERRVGVHMRNGECGGGHWAGTYTWKAIPKLPQVEIIGWRYADEQPEQPAKIPDPWADEREALQARVKELEDALQGLMDWQNGCPLPTWEKEYNKAMDAARAALKKH